MQRLRYIYELFNQTFICFNRDRAFRHGAAIAYYTLIALPAILIILIQLTGSLLGEVEVRSEILTQVEENFGAESRKQVAAIMNTVMKDSNSLWATVIGLGSLLFGATGVFYTLQDSINFIWGIRTPETKSSIFKLIFDRLLSLAMVLSLGFILTVSMILKTLLFALADLLERMGERFVEIASSFSPTLGAYANSLEVMIHVARGLEITLTFMVIFMLFMLIFRFLPDANLPFRRIWLGALLSAALFVLGETLLSWYIGSSTIVSAYGAAGSLVLILIWVYYSAQILLLGAEFIKVFSNVKGHEIKPSRFVERIRSYSLAGAYRVMRVILWRRKRAKKAQESEEKVETEIKEAAAVLEKPAPLTDNPKEESMV